MKNHPALPFALLAVALLILSSIPCSAVVYVKADSPGPALDGNSWETAYHSVQAAIDDADAADEEVWVAAGTYVANITLKAGVRLYGGFAGTEASLNERSWSANATILDGSAAGPVVTVATGADASTVIDGFTIRNGASSTGGGIKCVATSPIIARNRITGNLGGASGGGIFCDQASAPLIVDNIISRNRSSGSSPTGVGIMCDHDSNPAIINNTITGNGEMGSGGTIACANSSSPAIVNNIIAFCDSGILVSAGCSPMLSHNCVYSNYWFDYSGISAGNGDISVDPQFARRAVDDYHIMPSSPCRNAGTSGVAGLPTDGYDGQGRVEGSAIDIGADESYGETYTQNVIRVKQDSPTNGPGTDWSNAYHTVTEAMNQAAAGYEIWVAAGTYYGNYALKDGVALYGGFSGSEVARMERNRMTNATILDAGQSGSVVTVESGARLETTIDGFTIRDGTGNAGVETTGGGIYSNSASVTICNNTITGNSTIGKGGGIYCLGSYSSNSVVIRDNTITGNRCATYGGGGVYCQVGLAVFIGNTITNNMVANTPGAVQYGGGIRLICSRQVISGNTITDNAVSGSNTNGGGLHIWGGTALISNNVISRNKAIGSFYGHGGGLGWFTGTPTITGNIIEDNEASSSTPSQSGGGGIYWDQQFSGGMITGNIIRRNSTDYRGGGILGIMTTGIVQNNTISDNQAALGGGVYGGGDIIGNTMTGNIAAQNGGAICSGRLVAGNVIAHNVAQSGGAIYATSSTGYVQLNTIVDNEAAADGAAIYCENSSARIANNILAFNDSGVFAVGVAPGLYRNCTYGNTKYDYLQVLPDSYSISLDPMLADRAAGDYHLLASSPCIDTGDAAYGGYPDIDGQDRKAGGYPDIGADEFTGVATVQAPTFSPDGGVLTASTNVVVKCITPGVTIRYTTNGSEPTESDTVIASGSTVTVSASMTLKARAWKTGWTTSATRTAEYTVRAPAIFRVKSDAPGPAHDGSTWATAYLTIPAAMTGAAPGDEIWVAQGSYTDPITLKAGVGLYGGFAGTETARAARPAFPRAYPDSSETVLDGMHSATPVTVQSGATKISTVIDGFTIRNGLGVNGGGIECWEAAPTISNNLFLSNAANKGGAIHMYHASPDIKNNRFIGNSAVSGGGVSVVFQSVPTLSGNVFAGNGASSGGAITFERTSGVSFNNNTICGNQSVGGSLYCSNSVVMMNNNIIAFNSSGVLKDGNGVPALKYNCVYGNEDYNYSGITDQTGTGGNISADPKLADWSYGNLHIQADSPCRNTGDYQGSWTGVDMDGQPRVLPVSGRVDMGADESDGTTWQAGPYAVFIVSPGGDDANGGGHWVSPMATIQAAIDKATRIGAQVWVKVGTYNDPTELKPFAHVYGGFKGTESLLSQRPVLTIPWSSLASEIDAHQNGTVIRMSGGYRVSRIDGFILRNGKGESGGISCINASPTIANNLIIYNTAEQNGGGIGCFGSSPVILNTHIADNTSAGSGGGIYADSGRLTLTQDNVVRNTAGSQGGGIYLLNQSQVTASGSTIADNVSTGDGGGIYSEGSNLTLSNNIVAFNSSGIYKYADAATALLQNNDVFGNTAYNYSGVAAGTGDISVDPLFANHLSGNYHLLQGSGCINVGLNTAPNVQAADIDGQNRIYDGFVDIGSDEWWPPFVDAGGAKLQSNGTIVEMNGLIVTAVFGSQFYVENAKRSCGICVYKSGHGAVIGNKLDVKGTLSTSATGEKYLVATRITFAGSGTVDPIALVTRDIGGGNFPYDATDTFGQKGIRGAIGLNNIGLLVRTTGKVVARGTGYFYLDDGSGLREATGATGLKVQATGLTIPALDTFVQVTGISTCSKSGSDLVRLLRVRTQADIVPIE